MNGLRHKTSFVIRFDPDTVALLVLSGTVFWNVTQSAATSRKDPGPDATDKPTVQFHSAERFGPGSLFHQLPDPPSGAEGGNSHD